MAHSSGGTGRTGTAVTRSPRGSLKEGVVTLPGVLMQSVTSIAPAIAGLFTVPFIVANAGVGTPACLPDVAAEQAEGSVRERRGWLPCSAR